MKLLVEHVLQILGSQVGRVRIDSSRQAGEIDLKQVAGIDLVIHPIAVAIPDRTLANRFGFVELFDDLGNEQVELDLLAAPLVGFGLVDRVVELLGIVRERFIDGKVRFDLEQFHLGLESLILADQESIEDFVCEVDIPLTDLVVEGLRFGS